MGKKKARAGALAFFFDNIRSYAVEGSRVK
jgi:hypothetical protein